MSRTYRFGVYKFNGQTGELWKDGRALKLQPQPARLLELLVRHPGELVEREAIRHALWGTETVVDYQLGVNRCIRQIRGALLDNADIPVYIETVARKGYRFNPPVEELKGDGRAIDAPVASFPAPEQASALIPAADPPRPMFARRYWLLLFAIAAASAIVWFAHTPPSHLPSTFEVVPLASNLGYEYAPTFSPDGRQVAFTWNGKRQDNFDIYVKLTGSAQSLRLTNDPAVDYSPAWSPDGRSIAFCRGTDSPGGALWIIPALGGPARKIMDLHSIADPSSRAISWSPDGKWLVVADSIEPAHVNALLLVNAATGKRKQLTFPSPQEDDVYPAFSPDGGEIAFTRDSGKGFSSIYLLPFRPDVSQPQKAVRLNWEGFQDSAYGRSAWTPHDRRLIFESSRGGPHRLWMASATQDGQPKVLAQLGENLYGAAISSNGRLAYVRSELNSNIWRIDLAAARAGKTLLTTRVLASTRDEETPAVSPDGEKLAFASDRSGFTEVWESNVDGSDPMQLTFFKHFAGSPSWSRDGKNILFDSREEGDAHLYSVPASGGEPVKLMTGIGVVPVAARDGKWIYYSSKSSGSMQIWRLPQPVGPPQQITRAGGFGAKPAPDGSLLYYTKKNTIISSLWQMDLTNRREKEIASSIYLRAFVPAESAIYYFSRDAYGRYSLSRLDLKSGATNHWFMNVQIDERGVAISPDQRFLYYGQLDQSNSELMLVENFWH